MKHLNPILHLAALQAVALALAAAGALFIADIVQAKGTPVQVQQ